MKGKFRFFQNAWNKVKYFASSPVAIVANLASIVGLLITIFSNQNTSLIALIAFCVFLIGILFTLIYFVFNALHGQSFEEDCEKRATFAKYETIDGRIIDFEVLRFIQVKSLVATHFEHQFKWSGTNFPTLSSDFQELSGMKKADRDSGKWDAVILKFRKPLIYNQTEMVHFKAVMDDVDNISQPFVDLKIDAPVDVIHIRVILKHKETMPDGRLTRKRFNSEIETPEEIIKNVAYDTITKSFEVREYSPEPGYRYIFHWDK